MWAQAVDTSQNRSALVRLPLQVLPNRPLEVTIPMTRGLIARFATFMPSTAMSLGPTFNSQGRKKQEALKALRAPKE